MRQYKRQGAGGRGQGAEGKTQDLSLKSVVWSLESGVWSLKYMFLLLTAYCLLPTVPIFAEDKAAVDPNQPITITSNNMEAVKKENMVIFRGDVIAKHKDYTLYSKELYVYYMDGEEIREIVAIGDVKLVQLNKVAISEKAVYAKATRTLVLTGNPQVKQDCDMVKGEKITIFIDEDKSLVEGDKNKRVKAVMFPKDKNKKTKVKCK